MRHHHKKVIVVILKPGQIAVVKCEKHRKHRRV